MISEERNKEKQTFFKECEDYVAAMPIPFGSFEKSKYFLESNYNRKRGSYLRFFITTTINAEAAIEVLRDFHLSQWGHIKPRIFKVFRTKGGITEVIHWEKL